MILYHVRGEGLGSWGTIGSGVMYKLVTLRGELAFPRCPNCEPIGVDICFLHESTFYISS